MAPNSSSLAWKIPWMEELGRLQSMGSWRVRHDWVTSLSLFTFMHWRRKWQATPVFLPGESQGRGSLVGCRLWGHTELDTTEVTQQQQQQDFTPLELRWWSSFKENESLEPQCWGVLYSLFSLHVSPELITHSLLPVAPFSQATVVLSGVWFCFQNFYISIHHLLLYLGPEETTITPRKINFVHQICK